VGLAKREARPQSTDPLRCAAALASQGVSTQAQG
jgi:hypothetical protein